MIGRTISHYRVLALLGEGGMGAVYLAEDTTLGRRVALKMLPPNLVGKRGRLGRFRQEARTLASLEHPNIVSIHSIEEYEGLHFLTLELVEGRTLAEEIPSRGMELGRFFELAIPMADALASAHDHDVIHRDFKSKNVMVREDGTVKVLDFGLAKLLRDEGEAGAEVSEMTTQTMTVPGHLVGTVPYMAPEQIEGKPIDCRVDIFALGVVLYEMLCGRRPFQGASSASLIGSILGSEPPSVTVVRSALPRQMGRIVKGCLEKDPDDRFQSARDVRNALQALRDEIEANADTEAAASPGRARNRTRRLWGGVALVLVLVSVLFLLTTERGRGLWQSSDSSPPALAILPFDNLTGDPSKDYLSKGISAGLIGKLSGIRGLRLVGRSEIWSYLDSHIGPAELARKLGVGLVVDGHVQLSADDLQVTVSLNDTERSDVVWSEIFAADQEDLLRLELEIARRLTAALELPLSQRERRRMSRDPTFSYDAYDLYMRAQERLEGVDEPGSAQVAVELFRRAINTDPEFALAHVGLSEALWKLHRRSSDPALLQEAEREAEKALELDAELPEAQVALARVYRSTGRYDSSIAAIEGVLAAHPRPDDAQRELAFSYEQIGDLEEAGRCYRSATGLGSENWFNWNALGAFLLRSARYQEAEEAFLRALSVAPAGVVRPLQNLGGLRILKGDFEGALEAYEKIPRPIRSAHLAGNIGTAYYFSQRAERLERAEENYRLAVRLDPESPVIHGNLADLLAELGYEEEALSHYRTAMLLIEDELGHRAGASPSAFGSWRLLEVQRAYYAAKSEDCDKAVPLAFDLRSAIPDSARDVHQLAHIFALCEEVEAALETVRRAIDLGFSPELIAREDEFSALRDLPEFEALVGGTD